MEASHAKDFQPTVYKAEGEWFESGLLTSTIPLSWKAAQSWKWLIFSFGKEIHLKRREFTLEAGPLEML